MNIKNEIKIDPWSELEILKEAVIKEMDKRKNETAKLRQLNDWLRRELDLESRHLGFLAEVETLVTERRQEGRQDSHIGKDNYLNQETADKDDLVTEGLQQPGGKQRAHECRTAYVGREKKRGKNLMHVRSAYYRNDVGQIVGITFSSEKRDKKGTWFLNLKDEQFQEAVLLCEMSQDSVQVIHLPKRFLDKYARNMSKDHKGQVKFNVTRSNGRFYLLIPEPVGSVDVMEYVDSEPLVCPHYKFD
jgi:hypothetical protein